MTILPILFLISCKSAIICNQINSAKIVPILLYDISFKFDRCRVRCFDFNSWATLPLNKCVGMELRTEEGAINLPLENCEGLSGFSINDMAYELRPKIKKLDQIKKDYCN